MIQRGGGCGIWFVTSYPPIITNLIKVVTVSSQHCGGANNSDCPSSMRISDSWRAGYAGSGIVVTILDDGIEKSHPDLNHNYVSSFRAFRTCQDIVKIVKNDLLGQNLYS